VACSYWSAKEARKRALKPLVSEGGQEEGPQAAGQRRRPGRGPSSRWSAKEARKRATSCRPAKEARKRATSCRSAKEARKKAHKPLVSEGGHGIMP